MSNTLKDKTILVIGGSSGIGLATAVAARQHGGKVIIAGRDSAKLQTAKAQVGTGTLAHEVDIADDASVVALFGKIGKIDHLAITGPAPSFGQFRDLDLSTVQKEFEGKFWGQYRAAYHAVRTGMPDDGSITLMSGAYSARPVPGASTLAAVQAGLEGLARGLALDLSPIRVNAISPGLTDTPLIRGVFGDQGAQALYDQTAASLPAKRIVQPSDVAELYIFLMTNRSMTGSTLFPDGGYTLR
jgi:NAD(P)-dependent dehydrogenase (short-subunit alcohol dehydrogenase family)